jgi:protein-arginine deiminase
VVRDSRAWDGRVTIEFSVNEGGRIRRDRVAMRVAPVLTHHHLQRVEQVLAPLSASFVAHQQFVKDLEGVLASSGFTVPLRRLNTTDVWAQDVVEFGHVSMPRPGGALATLRIAIRSAQPGRAGGRAVFDLRGPGMGAIQLGGDDYHQADSFGNLETIPPYTHDGVRHPAGQIIYGDVGDGLAPHRDMMRFFESQEVQSPIVLDTSWLVIGHVDEFVQFLPADTPRGWKIAVVDVGRALDVLRGAQQRGRGGTAVYSRPGAPKITINQLLRDASFLEHNELARRKIELNLGILKAATGVRDDEIVRVPGLYRESEIVAATRRERTGSAATTVPPPGLPAGLVFPREKITYGPGVLAAFYPGAINGILIDARDYIAPKAWGPVENGRDILQQAVDAAYREAGLSVWSIDDWDSHHRIGGEVHCGTNTIRAVDSAWW